MGARRIGALVVAVILLVALTSQAASASYTGISRITRAALLATAWRAAEGHGDPHPYEIEAVRTTHRLAFQVTCHCKTGGVVPPNTPVYLVVIHGHFSCGCPVPLGAKVPSPLPILTLEMRMTEPHFADLGYGEYREAPRLKAAGIPVRLYSAPRHRV